MPSICFWTNPQVSWYRTSNLPCIATVSSQLLVLQQLLKIWLEEEANGRLSQMNLSKLFKILLSLVTAKEPHMTLEIDVVTACENTCQTFFVLPRSSLFTLHCVATGYCRAPLWLYHSQTCSQTSGWTPGYERYPEKVSCLHKRWACIAMVNHIRLRNKRYLEPTHLAVSKW